jgi:hypothetical protein
MSITDRISCKRFSDGGCFSERYFVCCRFAQTIEFKDCVLVNCTVENAVGVLTKCEVRSCKISGDFSWYDSTFCNCNLVNARAVSFRCQFDKCQYDSAKVEIKEAHVHPEMHEAWKKKMEAGVGIDEHDIDDKPATKQQPGKSARSERRKTSGNDIDNDDDDADDEPITKQQPGKSSQSKRRKTSPKQVFGDIIIQVLGSIGPILAREPTRVELVKCNKIPRNAIFSSMKINDICIEAEEESAKLTTKHRGDWLSTTSGNILVNGKVPDFPDVDRVISDPEADPGNGTCIVCENRLISVLLRPCLHASMCRKCCDNLATKLCPVCRHPYTKKIYFFLKPKKYHH